jgi:hypothetical protein
VEEKNVIESGSHETKMATAVLKNAGSSFAAIFEIGHS